MASRIRASAAAEAKLQAQMNRSKLSLSAIPEVEVARLPAKSINERNTIAAPLRDLGKAWLRKRYGAPPEPAVVLEEETDVSAFTIAEVIADRKAKAEKKRRGTLSGWTEPEGSRLAQGGLDLPHSAN